MCITTRKWVAFRINNCLKIDREVAAPEPLQNNEHVNLKHRKVDLCAHLGRIKRVLGLKGVL